MSRLRRRSGVLALGALAAAVALAAGALACHPGEGLASAAHASDGCACLCHAPARLDARAPSGTALGAPAATLSRPPQDAFASSDYRARLIEPPKALS